MNLEKLKKIIINRICWMIIIYFMYVLMTYYKNYHDSRDPNDFNIIYSSIFLKDNELIPDDFLRDYLIEDCSFAKKYISTIINISYIRDKNALFNYEPRLKKAFRACDMKKEELFFSYIDKNKRIKLDESFTEEEQIKLIINYYYLIEPQSLLAEMKRMSYQSEDALLIMEKLEIDIEWNKNHDWRTKDEHFYRYVE